MNAVAPVRPCHHPHPAFSTLEGNTGAMLPPASPGQGRRRLAALAAHLVVPPEPHTGPKLRESSAEASSGRSGGASLQMQDAGVVYSNPKPYLRAANAWHPSVVALPSGRWLVGFDR